VGRTSCGVVIRRRPAAVGPLLAISVCLMFGASCAGSSPLTVGTVRVTLTPCHATVGTPDYNAFYDPERLVIRRGNRVVVRQTIAGGRPYVLSLPTGEYQLSAPNLELAGIATVRVVRTSEANVGLQGIGCV
jgi:hypothetical protein